jgi:hypothetical protein
MNNSKLFYKIVMQNGRITDRGDSGRWNHEFDGFFAFSQQQFRSRLIRCKRIYNFLCSMLVLHQLLYVLSTLCSTFMIYLD